MWHCWASPGSGPAEPQQCRRTQQCHCTPTAHTEWAPPCWKTAVEQPWLHPPGCASPSDVTQICSTGRFWKPSPHPICSPAVRHGANTGEEKPDRISTDSGKEKGFQFATPGHYLLSRAAGKELHWLEGLLQDSNLESQRAAQAFQIPLKQLIQGSNKAHSFSSICNPAANSWLQVLTAFNQSSSGSGSQESGGISKCQNAVLFPDFLQWSLHSRFSLLC